MISAAEALECLREGNRRFASDARDASLHTSAEHRNELVDGQRPFAIILGCSDSRVPAEIVFDQGLGDLFVIRVAGNIVAPSQIGSIEYAAVHCGARLVVVLGHSHCGAVDATLEDLERPDEKLSPNLRAIVDRIRPAVEDLMTAAAKHDRAELTTKAVHANIHASVSQLRQGSKILEKLVENDELLIVGAEYSLETGIVNFFDETST